MNLTLFLVSFLNMVVEAPGPTDLTVSSELTYFKPSLLLDWPDSEMEEASLSSTAGSMTD